MTRARFVYWIDRLLFRSCWRTIYPFGGTSSFFMRCVAGNGEWGDQMEYVHQPFWWERTPVEELGVPE